MLCKNLLSHGHMYSLTGMFLGNCVNAHGEKELGTKRPDFMTPPMKKRREGAHVATFATASMAVWDLDHGVGLRRSKYFTIIYLKIHPI